MVSMCKVWKDYFPAVYHVSSTQFSLCVCMCVCVVGIGETEGGGAIIQKLGGAFYTHYVSHLHLHEPIHPKNHIFIFLSFKFI